MTDIRGKPADKITLEGQLFTLVELSNDGKDVDICAEIGGVNIWDWLKTHDGETVKINLEIVKDEED